MTKKTSSLSRSTSVEASVCKSSSRQSDTKFLQPSEVNREKDAENGVLEGGTD